MSALTHPARMTLLLRERGVFERHPFVLIDLGGGRGIGDAWRAFGPSLVAHAYGPSIDACEQAPAGEPFANVFYHARRVGLPDSHPFVQRREEDGAHRPNTNIWGRVTAGYLAQRAQSTSPGAAAAPRMADPNDVIGLDGIVRAENLTSVDFLELDVDEIDVLESAREVLKTCQVLGVAIEVNWFGSASSTEHTFHNTDRFMREQGFTLFGVTHRRYSRTDLPAPFADEGFASTRFGQPYQGDAFYMRDLAADEQAGRAAEYSPEKLIKLACIYELVGVPDCAAEVLNRFERRLVSFGEREPLLDALTPPLLGQQLSYRDYIARFRREPELFLPSAAAPPQPSPSDPVAAAPAAPAAPSLPRRIKHRVRERAAGLPPRLVGVIAAGLARTRPLALDPDWHFHVPGNEAGMLTRLRRDIWAHYRENRIGTPIVFRWYEGLRVRLYLGSDLSLCLYVLGAFEPNAFVFLSRVLERDMVVLDGGANEGLFTLYAARRAGPRGAVLAVEPSSREFERLEANIALNRLANVATHKVALGSRTGEAILAVAEPEHAGMNAIDVRDAGETLPGWTESTESVAVETIDEIVARSGLQRLDLIKLDIEGSEVDALEGASSALSRFRPLILLEAEQVRLARQGRSRQDLVQALDALGYDLWVFDADSAQLRRAEGPDEPEGNAVAAPRGWRPPALG